MMAAASVGNSLVAFTLPIGILILSVAWVILRLTGVLRLRDEPKRDKKSSTQSRRAEAVMLLCGSLVIWIFTATNTSTGGRLFRLDQLHPAFARVNVIVAGLSLLGVLCSCLIAARWSSSLGVVLCAAVLIVYPSMLNGSPEWLESFVSNQTKQQRTILRFVSEVCDLPDAELYVNGVCLGKLPVEINEQEFLDKVPVWYTEPNRLELSEIPEHLIAYRSTNSASYSVDSFYQKLYMRMANGGECDDYYAQVKYQDQWCYATGPGGGSGGGGGYIRHMQYGLSFLNADYERRLSELLDYGRIHDYQVPATWFETMATYGTYGLKTLFDKEVTEPGIGFLLDRWAAREYGLTAVYGSDSAWQVFEGLCEKIEASNSYSTEGLEGRAVAWLSLKLPMDKLTDRATTLIRKTDRLHWSQWQSHGRQHFGTSTNGARSVGTGRRIIGQGSWGRSGGQLPIQGYAVAHAMWVLFQQGEAGTKAVLQGPVMTEVIAKLYKNLPRHRFLCAVGGPVLERFLIRQNWEADPAQLPRDQRAHAFREETNGWFWMLAYLDTPVGREFRKTHRKKLFQVAGAHDPFHSFQDMAFFLLDLDQGADSLASEYWPKFLKNTLDRYEQDSQALKYAFKYLVMMDPVSTPDMYVQALREIRHTRYPWEGSFRELSNLPSSRRDMIYHALKEAIGQDLSHLGLSDSKSVREGRAYMLRSLEDAASSDQATAVQVFQRLNEGVSGYAVKWLQNLNDDHGTLPLLAKSDRADLRRLALYGIESHPSPAHRALLRQLLRDPDTEVSGAAEAVRQNLDQLADTPLKTLRAN